MHPRPLAPISPWAQEHGADDVIEGEVLDQRDESFVAHDAKMAQRDFTGVASIVVGFGLLALAGFVLKAGVLSIIVFVWGAGMLVRGAWKL